MKRADIGHSTTQYALAQLADVALEGCDDLAAPDLSIDHAAAEQVALAANSLAATLVRLRPEVLRGGLPEALERLYATVQDPYDFDRDRFAQDLERFSREVRKLP